jgi:hypothetical protein
MFSTRKARLYAVAAVASGAAIAAVAGGGVANAGTPSPSPSPHHVRVVATPWQFDLEQSDIGSSPALHFAVNDVESGNTGILMRNWHDVQLSPNVDKFVRGANSVTIRHDSLLGAVASENARTCTVTLDQNNGRFRILAGTGTGAGIRSLGGRFDLVALLSFPLDRYGRCSLRGLSLRHIVRAINSGGPSVLPVPSFVDVAVQGRADLVRVAPIHIFAPTASPSATASA